MNYSIAVFLINKNTRAIACTYEEGEKAPIIIFKTLDPKVSVNDLVIVPTDTRHRFTVVKVKEVDVDIDLDTQTAIKWIVGRVDLSAHAELVGQENDAISKIKSAEVRKKREALRDAMLADQIEEIGALPIAALNGPSTPTA